MRAVFCHADATEKVRIRQNHCPKRPWNWCRETFFCLNPRHWTPSKRVQRRWRIYSLPFKRHSGVAAKAYSFVHRSIIRLLQVVGYQSLAENFLFDRYKIRLLTARMPSHKRLHRKPLQPVCGVSGVRLLPALATAEQLAEVIQVSPRTIHNWAGSGNHPGGPALREGGALLPAGSRQGPWPEDSRIRHRANRNPDRHGCPIMIPDPAQKIST